VFLQIFFLFEVNQKSAHRRNHQEKGKRITPFPVQFGQYAEVHAVNAGDQRGRHEYYRYDGEDFNDFILLNINQTKESILKIIQAVKTEADVFQQGIDVFNQDG
jgi:hypothetical protein